MYPYQQQPPPQHVVHHVVSGKNPTLAVILEVGPGFFFQTFGIGHLYAGNTGLGLLFMFGYWALTFVNFLLCFIFIGFITWPICWIAMMVMSPILASNAAKTANARFGR
jgi:TM2 domain-containing membrane protein YozV